MKKIIIFLFILLFITGCDVKNNIVINKDLSVSETVSMTGTSSFFNVYSKMLPINVIKEQLESDPNKNLLDQNNYSYEIDKTVYFPRVVASKNYNSIDDYTKNTIFKDYYFKNFNTISKDSLITIQASDFINGKEVDDEDRYIVSQFVYEISVPYFVTKSNADEINYKKNTYKWFINSDTTNKEINLTFNQKIPFVYNWDFYVAIIGFSILFIIVIVYVLKIIKRNKKNNKTD